MRRPVLLFLFLSAMSFNLFAAGKIYWQPNGILITNRDGMVGLSPVPDGKGGVIVFASDGMDSIFTIKVDKNGNLPWTLHGKVLDDNGFGGFQGGPKSVSDGKGGAIAVWSRWYPWGHNLYYNRIDSLGNKAWAGNGVPLTLSDSTQEYHQVVSDGAGGAIAAWQEQSNGQWDIYAQRVDSNGLRQWGDYGKVVCNATNTQERPAVNSDKSCNGYLIWADYRNTKPHIYIDKLKNSDGSSLWQLNGKIICDTDSGQGLSGYGNIIILNTDTTLNIVWHDYRNGNNDVFSQLMDLSGAVLWDSTGKIVCDTVNLQGACQIINDGKDGCIYCWIDQRTGYKNLYAQRLNLYGNKIWTNQGNAICATDSVYWYHRMMSDNSSGALITWQDKRNGNYDIYAQHIDSTGNVKWQINGMVVCTTTYSQESPEMAPSDSNTAIIIWCDARSGYFRGYAQRVGDDPNGVEGTPNSELQIANCKLNQNYPNPFHQSTMINYQLTQTGLISLKIYNIAGQLVRSLDDGYQISGFYSVKWDGREDNGHRVGTGVYFYQLQIDGNIARTKKMLKIK